MGIATTFSWSLVGSFSLVSYLVVFPCVVNWSTIKEAVNVSVAFVLFVEPEIIIVEEFDVDGFWAIEDSDVPSGSVVWFVDGTMVISSVDVAFSVVVCIGVDSLVVAVDGTVKRKKNILMNLSLAISFNYLIKKNLFMKLSSNGFSNFIIFNSLPKLYYSVIFKKKFHLKI